MSALTVYIADENREVSFDFAPRVSAGMSGYSDTDALIREWNEKCRDCSGFRWDSGHGRWEIELKDFVPLESVAAARKSVFSHFREKLRDDRKAGNEYDKFFAWYRHEFCASCDFEERIMMEHDAPLHIYEYEHEQKFGRCLHFRVTDGHDSRHDVFMDTKTGMNRLLSALYGSKYPGIHIGREGSDGAFVVCWKDKDGIELELSGHYVLKTEDGFELRTRTAYADRLLDPDRTLVRDDGGIDR